MEENLNNNQQPPMQEPKKQDIGSKTKKKKAKIAVITLSTIIVLVLGLQIYAATNGYGNIFFMIRDWTTSKNASGEDEVFKEGKTTIEELDVNSSMVKNLYEYIPAFNENRIRVNAYQNKKITKNDLDNKYLLAYAFKNLELKDSEKTTTMQNGQPLDGWYSFEASKLQDKAKEMYGTEIENEDFEIGYGAGCTYKNQKYSYSSGGGSGEYMTNIKNIEKAYQENDLLFIEDKYIAIKENGDKAALYKASNSNIELETIDLSNYTDEDTLSKYIMKKHSNKMISFKHTFKKNSDGNYYWYSTEPLEEIKEEANTTNNDTDADFFEKNANIQYNNDLTNSINGKAAIIKSGEEELKTTQNNGYYTYTDMWNNSYNIKKIKDVKSEFTQLGKDKQSALYKCTIYYIDNNNQDKNFDVAVIVSKDAEGGILGTYDSYTGSTRYTRWVGLYDEGNTENNQLEPDNYAEMVEIDNAYDKFLEKMPKNKTTKSTRIDIDNDGVHELIVAKGDFEAEKEISFYTYKNGKVTDLGTHGFGHSALYKMNNKDYLLQVYGQMGSEEVSKVYIKNGKKKIEKISERQINLEEGYTKGDVLLQELIY